MQEEQPKRAVHPPVVMEGIVSRSLKMNKEFKIKEKKFISL